MPSVLGVLERRERVALARAEELRAELERLAAAVAEADEAARRAVIAREETVEAQAEAADGAAVSGAAAVPVAVGVGPRVEVPLWREGLGIDVLPHECARIVALVERDAAGGGEGCGRGSCGRIWGGPRSMRGSRRPGSGRSGWWSGAG
jgi:hypothetical protein